jgi:hypothetical protein
MASSACPACARPVAMARASCVYCGAALSAEQVTAAAAAAQALASEGAPPPAAAREIVVLDVRSVAAEVLTAALGVPDFEAGQRVRRGGYQLHRIADPASARQEAARLAAAGLPVRVVPEDEARAAALPLLALGGRLDEQTLELRTADGPRRVANGDVLLVVRGPISRTLEPPEKFRRVRLAGPDEGQRIHLHLHAEPRPLEIDPEDFEVGTAPLPLSSSMTLLDWLREVAGTAPVDEGFRFLAPALGPAVPPPAGTATGAAQALSSSRSAPRPALFDNLAQFRFYSGWRAAVERLAPGA